MRIRIVCYEDPNGWILGKFARRLHEELLALGAEAELGREPDPAADINHHIIYLDYDGRKNSTDTIMITHVDSIEKLTMIKRQTANAAMAITMSAHTMESLANAGVDRRKLCFVNPAHDEVMVPRKLALGITSKTHNDGRKKEGFLTDLAAELRPEDFMFKVMGSGWDNQVQNLRDRGFEVVYFPEFDREEYLRLMPSLDYYMYMSHDEGSMGFIDALAAGVKTIVTPQGYHLDAPGGISHAIDCFEDIARTLRGIAAERRLRLDSVKDWTWRNYALKHLEVWERLLARAPPAGRAKAPGKDGISSMWTDQAAYVPIKEGRAGYLLGLCRNYIFFRYKHYKRKLLELLS